MSEFVALPATGEKVETLNRTGDVNRQVVAVGEMSPLLELLLQMVSNLAMALDPSNSRLRAVIEANNAVNQSMNAAQIGGQAPSLNSGAAAAGTLRTVNATDSPLNLIGGIQASPLVLDMMAIAYGQLIRPRIT